MSSTKIKLTNPSRLSVPALRAELARVQGQLISQAAEAADLRWVLEGLQRDVAHVLATYCTPGLGPEALRVAVGGLLAKRIAAGDPMAWRVLQ
jgi:hypothetical protein